MSSESNQPLQGMSDLYAPDIHLWRQLEQKAHDLLDVYGFEEVRTPILERTSVFERSLGDTTEVVQKEMYRFEDRGGRAICLRPEGTAGVMRYVASRGQDARDARLYYVGPMFRSERPQAGRRRQFHQLGAELLGPPCPASDVECIALQAHLLSTWGLEDFCIQLNTRGLPEDRPRVAEGLRDALADGRDRLCEDCIRRYEQNPLRILDCKQAGCREMVASLPSVRSFMSDEANAYYDEVLSLLRRLEIPVVENPLLVRGLDYYVHTVWEITHDGLGAQDALSGGGRYALPVGRDVVEGVGFAVGMERVIAALAGQGMDAGTLARPVSVWLVSQGDDAFEENMLLMQLLRMRGVSCAMDMRRRSIKAQMRAAHRSGAPYVVIRGERELETGVFQLKTMENGGQEELDMPALFERLTKSMEIISSSDASR